MDVDALAAELLVPHVVAHQWWGNFVGWSSDSDSWLSEGFANGSAWLFVQRFLGQSTADQVLENWQWQLTNRDLSGRVPADQGPMSLGFRLASSLDPAAFDIVTFDKGGYVLEMLATMLRETDTNGEARFQAMMRDYMTTYANRSASTADFERVAEKYMTLGMAMPGQQGLDWFFREYLGEPGVPEIQFHSVVKADNGGYDVSMQIANPGHWYGLLPVDIDSGAGAPVHVLLSVRGTDADGTMHLATRPVAIIPDRHHEALLTIRSEGF